MDVGFFSLRNLRMCLISFSFKTNSNHFLVTARNMIHLSVRNQVQDLKHGSIHFDQVKPLFCAWAVRHLRKVIKWGKLRRKEEALRHMLKCLFKNYIFKSIKSILKVDLRRSPGLWCLALCIYSKRYVRYWLSAKLVPLIMLFYKAL